MELIYKTLHFKGSEQLEAFARNQMERIFNKTAEIQRAELTFFEGASGNLENQFCEISLIVPGKDIFVKKNATTYEQAIRLAVVAVQKIIRRRKK